MMKVKCKYNMINGVVHNSLEVGKTYDVLKKSPHRYGPLKATNLSVIAQYPDYLFEDK